MGSEPKEVAKPDLILPLTVPKLLLNIFMSTRKFKLPQITLSTSGTELSAEKA